MIYQYKITDENDWIEFFWELQQDYPIYVREVRRLKDILLQFNNTEFTVVAEPDYVDKQYRDSYYSYFSQKYTEYERNCLRLAFFEGKISQEQFADCTYDLEKIFIGTVVLRPLEIGNIGQTLLNPKKLNVKGYFRTCVFRVMVYGRKLNIEAFPYSSQDGETMTCAETVLFNLIYYYGTKYSEYRVLMPSEILQDIERESYERVLPSMGVYEANMAKVLADAHFYPRIYSYQEGFNDILYSYIESGIPLILSLPEHVVSCVGHGLIRKKLCLSDMETLIETLNVEQKEYYTMSTETLCDEYIVMDDNKAPYYKTTLDDIVIQYANDSHAVSNVETIKSKDVSIIVPLYRRIFIDAARAESIFKSLFLENDIFLDDIRDAYSDETWGIQKENPFVWRMYLTASRSYKDFKTRKTSREELKYFYMECSLPRFIWVLEIGTMEEYLSSPSRARVEILLDATSSPNSETRGILSVGYKDHFIFVPEDLYEKDEDDFEDEDDDRQDDSENDIEDIDLKDFYAELGNNFALTKLFEMLYTNEYEFFDDTFEIFSDSNLERNF